MSKDVDMNGFSLNDFGCAGRRLSKEELLKSKEEEMPKVLLKTELDSS